MTTFTGEIECRIDSKSRIIIPSAFLRQLSDKNETRFVIRRDFFDECLELFPWDEWLRQVNNLRQKINPYNRDHSKVMEAFYRGTAELILDSCSRLLIPRRLIEKINLGKELILVAQDDRIKIWDKYIYEEREKATDEDEIRRLLTDILGKPN
ncbi:MAG: division/cell wall cluster transcriptional repressor MraZ [Bacteroidia bacterium]|nr:division/cell wall cluster transcriptional repressor MraZ [Bacteroidia bacterium]